MELVHTSKQRKLIRDFVLRNLRLVRTTREQDVLMLRYGTVSGPYILEWEDIGNILQIPADIVEPIHDDALAAICRLSGEDDKPLLLEIPLSKIDRFKQMARLAARRAIKRGDLTPKPCERCGEVNSEAHHPDYRNALVVTWLCKRCHGIEHRQQPNAA